MSFYYLSQYNVVWFPVYRWQFLLQYRIYNLTAEVSWRTRCTFWTVPGADGGADIYWGYIYSVHVSPAAVYQPILVHTEYDVFDLVFFPTYYKNGYKAGKAFVIAAIPMLLLMVIVEGAVHIPALAWLDSYAMQDQLRQLPILLIGIVCYIALLSMAYRISVKRFERVDL